MAEPVRLRDRDQVARFFDGLDLVEPGIVAVDQWRTEPGTPTHGGYYAAIAK